MIDISKVIHYSSQMYLKISVINIMKCMNLTHFLAAPGLAWQAYSEKTRVKLKLLTNNDFLMMVEKGIRDEMCHAIYRYPKANKKYMKNYNKNIELLFLL